MEMPDQPVEDDVIERRAAHFRELRQGEGLTLEKLQALGDEVRVFGVDTPEEALDLIRIAATSMLDNQYAVAIRNALGIGNVVEGKLTERRYDLLERSDVKLRMLMRHEDEGAEMLARQIDITRQLRPDLSAGVDMVDLIGRIDGVVRKFDDVDELKKRLDAIEVIAIAVARRVSVLTRILGRVLRVDGGDMFSTSNIEKVFSASIAAAIPEERLRSIIDGLPIGASDAEMDTAFEDVEANIVVDLVVEALFIKYWGYETVAQFAEEANNEDHAFKIPDVELKRASLYGDDSEVESLKNDVERLKREVAILTAERTKQSMETFLSPNRMFGDPGPT
ncbi:hypothetical protein RR21198_4023 [Rhodococcus rhodochrous ATCC 21198]|uniref:hypothetical protein n=1 Tax=Rhodococcus aetherivorans TaxID=191292 RepID=UPI0003E1C543|nr:hypothetical protein [Rhodococcus aetherivorans]ETT25283.1 hypothetical protein RR21198_4023 [Rhodococcus rhodochrous ATCC 21198]NGP28444.1 hypothetical protein [Rhodococcus aetherivorans]